MEIIPDKRKLVSLVEQVHTGKVCLPNFQRDFVWPRDQVADLLRSVLRGYFVGSLLLLRCDPQNPPFAPVFLKGAAPPNREPHPELLVLDGQQRLTALLYALTAPKSRLKDSSQPRLFFVNLDLVRDEPDSDAIVFDCSERELDGLDRAEEQYRRHVLPATCLFKPGVFMKWRDGLDDWLRENDPAAHERYRREWRDPWTNAINEFQDFQIPLVELPAVSDSDNEAMGRVCAIFEKLNSTGVELSVYDLLTARLFRSGIKLHDLWTEACRQHRRLNEWCDGKADKNKFGVLLLRTLALLRGLDPKPRFLIGLQPERFADDLSRSATAVERALTQLTLVAEDGFGVFDPKWLPGFGLVPILAALRDKIEERRLGENARADLRHWYWCNVFLERYSSAVESKSRRDYAEMLQYWDDGRTLPSVFTEARNRIGASGYGVRESATTGSAVYRGVFCLLALRNARDWRRGENLQLQKLQDHHIFPKGFLKNHAITTRRLVNTIVNRTLISDETNNKIKAKAPADYLSDPDIFPSGTGDRLLVPHFLNESAVAAMRDGIAGSDNEATRIVYERFCAAREAAIVAEIRRVCGLPSPP